VRETLRCLDFASFSASLSLPRVSRFLRTEMNSQAQQDDAEQAYRDYLRSIAVLLVPPSSPIISSLLATAHASLDLAPLEIGHNERNIDFWDERKEGMHWEKEKEEKWEMSREEVEGIKRERKEFMDRVKREDGEEERWRLGAFSTSSLHLSRIDLFSFSQNPGQSLLLSPKTSCSPAALVKLQPRPDSPSA
jgi:hypothetical protein